MTYPAVLHISHLHSEARDTDRSVRWLDMLAEVERLKNSLRIAQRELQFLTVERDELVHALRTWARTEEEPGVYDR